MINREYIYKKIPKELHITDEFACLMAIIKENNFADVKSLSDSLDKSCEKYEIELEKIKKMNAGGSSTIKMRECAIRIGSFKRCKGLVEDFLL